MYAINDYRECDHTLMKILGYTHVIVKKAIRDKNIVNNSRWISNRAMDILTYV